MRSINKVNLTATLVLVGALVGIPLAATQTTCYHCTSDDADCSTDYLSVPGVSKEQNCNDFGFIEDGGCSITFDFDSKKVTRTCGQVHNNDACPVNKTVDAASWYTRSWNCSCEGDRCNGIVELPATTTLSTTTNTSRRFASDTFTVMMTLSLIGIKLSGLCQ